MRADVQVSIVKAWYTPWLIVVAMMFAIVVYSCQESPTKSGSSCGTYNGRSLQLGPEGGCYYINSSGKKTYVDRSNCKC
jgi:hypothetical protein